jgi:hypothetical protein
VVTVNGPHGQTSTVVEKPFVRIGSHQGAEVALPDGEIAPCALYFHAADAGIYFVRLDQDATTDGPVRGWLQADQEIRLGAYRISAECSAAPRPDAGLPPGRRPFSALPQPLLIFSRRGREISHYRLRRRLTVVGRRQSCTMRLKYSHVSRAHCIFYRSAKGLWVIDLLSTYGSILGGCSVEAAEWPIGSDLVLGDIAILHGSVGVHEKAEGGVSRSVRGTVGPSEELFRRREVWQAECAAKEGELATRAEVLKMQASRIAAEREVFARDRAILEQQQEELVRQREAWQSECAAREGELATRGEAIKEEVARIAAEREAFARERVLLEQQFARERVLLEQQQQEEFSRQREAWQAECAAKEDELAARLEGFEEQDAHIAAEREASARERVSFELRQCRASQGSALWPARETGELSRGGGFHTDMASEGMGVSAEVVVQKEEDWEEEKRYREFYERLIDRLIEREPGERTRWRWWGLTIAVCLVILAVILAAAGVFHRPHSPGQPGGGAAAREMGRTFDFEAQVSGLTCSKQDGLFSGPQPGRSR